MTRKLTLNRSHAVGVALLALGMVVIFNLWWALPALILAAVGAYIYVTRRKVGDRVAAVQGLLWLLGMALLFVFDFVFPGILFVAGGSLLARGREVRIDTTLVDALARLGVRLDARPAQPTRTAAPALPHAIETPQPQRDDAPDAVTGKTTRM